MEILGKKYLLVTLDFETYYAPKYTLTAMNTFEYITHELFSIHGVGTKIENGPNLWFRDTEEALAHIDNSNPDDLPVALLCHNTYFDGFILHKRFNWHPDLYLDTMSMSRGMFPTQSAGLASLAERLWPDDPRMRKGKELIQFKGVTTEQLWGNPALEQTMVRYCIGDNKKDLGDVGLTYHAFQRMLPFYPDNELALIDLTLQMMCMPLLRIDVPRVVECRDNAIRNRDALIKASGLSETLLSSNAQFERWLIANNIPVPLKPSPTQTEKDEAGNEVPVMIPALGKSDLGFQEMRKLYPEHEPVWAARIAAKSVGEITRAERFIATAEQCDGLMPVALAYYAAHTGRYGGCLSAGTVVSVYNAHSGPEDKYIVDVQDDDLVWDGEEYVRHDGVVFSGVKEVITYDGITGTPDHIVFTACGAEKPLAQARADGDSLKVCPSPKSHLLGLAGADTRTHDKNESEPDLCLWENEGGTGIGCTSRGEQELSQLRAVSEDGRGTADTRTAGYASCDDGESRAGQLGAPLSPLSITGGDAIGLESPARADDSSQATVQQWTPQLRGSRDSLPVRQSEPSSGMGDTTLGAANPGAEHRQGRQQLPLHAGQPALGGSDNPVEQSPDVHAESDRAAHQALEDAAPGLQLRVDPHVREPGDDRRADIDEGQVPTYDILNCGPRHRFVANGKLVHNSEKLNLQNLGRGSELRKSLCAPDGQLVYVADSSNIEARMLAWMAGQDDLLEVFRSGADVYAYTAQDIYNRPIDKKRDPHERFVGKVTALGLGYGMGWRKFRDTLAAGALGGPPVLMEDHEVQHIVNTFRSKRWAIKQYWQQAENAIVDMYMGNSRQWGALTIHKNCLVMPNGMALQYPGLRPIEPAEDGSTTGGWEYWEGKFWKKLYGGALTENICQALSRIVLFDQMLAINELFKPHGGRVVMNVHDEIIAVGPNLGKDDENPLFRQMIEIMRTPPSWCADLPLDGEGGTAVEYSK